MLQRQGEGLMMWEAQRFQLCEVTFQPHRVGPDLISLLSFPVLDGDCPRPRGSFSKLTLFGVVLSEPFTS